MNMTITPPNVMITALGPAPLELCRSFHCPNGSTLMRMTVMVPLCCDRVGSSWMPWPSGWS